MLWLLFVVLLVIWAGGFALHLVGAAIHVLLVLALIVLVYNLVTGGRRGTAV